MKTKILLLIMVAAPLFSACEDFLSLKPAHEQTIENTVKSYEEAQYVLNGMYATITLGSGSTGSDFFGGKYAVALSSQAGIARAGGGTYYNMSYVENTPDLGTFWQNWYACVNAANAAVISISALDEAKFPDADEKNRMIGEARCFRAWSYSHILWCFCHFWKDDEYGLLYREQLSDLSNIFAGRIGVRESYEKIFADLDHAIAYLGDYTSTRVVSRQLAQVLKAKLLLNRGWEGDYRAALDLVDDVLATAPASFAMDPDMANMYDQAWDSKEVLWARYLEDASYPTRASQEYTYAYGIVANADVYTEGTPPVSLNTFYPEFDSWFTEDPRYGVTMGTAKLFNFAWSPTYWVPTKLCRMAQLNTSDKFTTYYVRYPELLLMQAELRARTGSTVDDALAPLNLMRRTRTNPVLPEIATPPSVDELMDIIFREYCLELYMENGSEWFAALRFSHNGRPWLYSLKPEVQDADENKYCWPVPAIEVGVNNRMKQNPGYIVTAEE